MDTGARGAAVGRTGEREDDLSLFLWLVEELRRFEAQPEPGPEFSADDAARRARGLRRAAATVAARLDED